MSNMKSKIFPIIEIEPESNQLRSQNLNTYNEQYTTTNRKITTSEVRFMEIKPINYDNQQLYHDEIIDSKNHMKKTQTSINVKNPAYNIPDFNFIQTENLVVTNKLIDSPSKQSILDSPKKYNNRLKAAGNVVLSIRRLQQQEVEHISTVNQLQETLLKPQIQNYKTPTNKQQTQHKTMNTVNEILDNLKMIDRFIYYAQHGSEEDVQKMIKLLGRYPKRHLLSSDDPKHLINSLNKYEQNALYIAAKNGNIKVIELLLSCKVNPHIKSKVNNKIYESPLEVSTRWNHLICVKLLLEYSQYTQQEIKNAIKISNNQDITSLLKSYLTNTNIFSCCF